MAKASEDIKDYEVSFNYLVEGNRLRKKELNYTIDTDRRLFSKIKDIFVRGDSTPGDITNEQASISPIFIVGMPRSGTTLVEQILASHSKVHGAGELEVMNKIVAPVLSNIVEHNGNLETKTLSTEQAITIRDNYLKALTALIVPEKIITDKMPINFQWVGFILSAFPHAKIIHLNRDPRAVCWSIYKHNFTSKGNGNGYAYDLDDLVEFYKLYTDLMSFWHEQYPSRIYDIGYEALTENQEEETRNLLEYCDLEWENQCLDFHKTKRAVKTASSVQVRKSMYQGSSEAWRKYEEWLQPLIDNLRDY